MMKRNPQRPLFFLTILLMVSGCYLLETPNPQISPEFTPETSPLSTDSSEIRPTPLTAGEWLDALDVMRGICFEAALDAAGQVFILRGADDLAGFFDLADNSRLCRRPVQRAAFAFGEGQIIAGVWNAGRGCTARHDVIAREYNAAENTLTLTLQFITEGDCPYELVRPFWISGAYADILLNVQPEPAP